MPIQILKATESMVETILPLMAEQQSHYGLIIDDLRNRESLRSAIKDSADSFQIVAVDRDCAVGFLMINIAQSFQWATKIAYLHDLYVTPSYRGGEKTGVGAQLLFAAFGEVLARGIQFAEAETDVDNTAAQALYDRMLAGRIPQRFGVTCFKWTALHYFLEFKGPRPS